MTLHIQIQLYSFRFSIKFFMFPKMYLSIPVNPSFRTEIKRPNILFPRLNLMSKLGSTFNGPLYFKR